MEPCRKRSRCNEAYISFPPSLKDWENIEINHDLYPSVLLHLGYVAPEKQDECNATDEPLVPLLCQHWEKLTSIKIFDADLELGLAAKLLSSVKHQQTITSILNVVLTIAVTPPKTKIPQYLLKLLVPHLKVGRNALDILRHQSKYTPFANSLFAAACVVRSESIDGDDVDENLRGLAEQIIKREDCSIYLNETCKIKVFLWALCHFREYAMPVTKMDQILDYLTDKRESDTLSILAAHYPSDKVVTRLEFIYLSPDSDCEAREHALSGLISLVDTLSISNKLLDAMITATKANAGQNRNAVTLLVRLYGENKIQTQSILHLLNTTETKTAELLVIGMSQQHEFILKNPSLLVSMAKLAKQFSSHPMRLALMRTVEELTLHQCHWHDLARNSPIVSILVSLIDQEPTVMEILWKISTPIFNRRVLAKQPGLLPICIRWARSLPFTDPRRNKWKSRLLDLASVL